MGALNGAFIDTAMTTISVKLTNKKKEEQNRQRTENVVANVCMRRRVSRFVGKLAGVLGSRDFIINLKKGKTGGN